MPTRPSKNSGLKEENRMLELALHISNEKTVEIYISVPGIENIKKNTCTFSITESQMGILKKKPKSHFIDEKSSYLVIKHDRGKQIWVLSSLRKL